MATVKDRIYEILGDSRGIYISGEELAGELNVSRTAVWKAVNALRSEGCPIDGTTNKGYSLSADYDLFKPDDIISSLSEKALSFYSIEAFPVVTSTNTVLRTRGQSGAPEGTTVIAEQQTNGRGRMGRRFFSPRGTGLYISILLRPDMPAADAVHITTMSAVAAARSVDTLLRESGADEAPTQIKWVNDLFLRGRKIAGILTEADLSMETGRLSQAVMGIGFNICPPDAGWPDEISRVAGSIFEKRPLAGTRARLAAIFLNEFIDMYEKLPEHSFSAEYRSRQLVIGRRVEVLRNTEVLYTAEAIDVDDDCNLIVIKDGESEPTILNSGEIRAKPAE